MQKPIDFIRVEWVYSNWALKDENPPPSLPIIGTSQVQGGVNKLCLFHAIRLAMPSFYPLPRVLLSHHIDISLLFIVSPVLILPQRSGFFGNFLQSV